MSDKRSFWTTLPGFATGTATVITAVLGVLGLLRAGGGGSGGQEAPSPSSSPTPSTSNSARENKSSADFNSSAGEPVARTVPSTLNFGKQGVGRSSSVLTVTLTNIGEEGLTIEAVELSGEETSQFEITQNNCDEQQVLEPRDGCEIGVRFSPRSIGGANATMKVAHNGVDGSEEVSLAGEGVLLQL